jgi:carboxylesterase
MLPLVIVTALFAGVAALREVAGWRLARAIDAQHPRGADGIVVGAESFELAPAPGSRHRGAILALHGFGDTPQTVRYLAEALAARGWLVRAPLLPGHGRTIAEFARTRAADWLAAVREEYSSLRAKSDHTVVLGVSMGGALATILAAASPDLPALVLIAPYLAMPRWLAAIAVSAPVLGVGVRYMVGGGVRSITDPVEAERNLAYGAVTPRLVAELRRVVVEAQAAEPKVRAPVLFIQSHHDNRIAPEAAEAAFARLGSSEKQLVWVDKGTHIITVDVGRDIVIGKVADWLDNR